MKWINRFTKSSIGQSRGEEGSRGRPFLKRSLILGAVVSFVILSVSSSEAELFVHITGEPDNGASIDSEGNLTEGGLFHRAIYKPVPRPSWVRLPWLSPSQAFRGRHSVGMEIRSTEVFTERGTDKVNLRISDGHDAYALDFASKKYTGFAVRLGAFDIPSTDMLMAQWWQGSPHVPPLQLHIVPNTDPIQYSFLVRNNDATGLPSAPSIVLPFDPNATSDDITLSADDWHTFVVYTRMRHTGQPDDGEIRVWHNGVEVIQWFGKVGYDPSINLDGRGFPNRKFDVFFGPYRGQQDKRHQFFFDEIRFASTFAEANPDQ